MFEKQYSTCEIAERVGLDLQIIMWSMIDEWNNRGIKVDYLQVYDLSIECTCGEVYQKVEHSQEIPKKTETLYYRNIETPISGKIFIIDEDSNGVMMFANEY